MRLRLHPHRIPIPATMHLRPSRTQGTPHPHLPWTHVPATMHLRPRLSRTRMPGMTCSHRLRRSIRTQVTT
jgi:hypothetical protein